MLPLILKQKLNINSMFYGFILPVILYWMQIQSDGYV